MRAIFVALGLIACSTPGPVREPYPSLDQATMPAAPQSPPPIVRTPTPAPAPAPASDRTFVVGAREIDQLFVLAYRTRTRALEQIGNALPLSGPLGEEPTFEYLWQGAGERVIAVIKYRGGPWEVFAGQPGTAWRSLGRTSKHAFVSDDRDLVIVGRRVVAWNGRVVYTIPEDRHFLGFAERGRAWVTYDYASRGDRREDKREGRAGAFRG